MRPESDEDEALLWQDVIDQVSIGQRANLKCPFCTTGAIAVEETPEGNTRLACSQCRRFVEGKLQK